MRQEGGRGAGCCCRRASDGREEKNQRRKRRRRLGERAGDRLLLLSSSRSSSLTHQFSRWQTHSHTQRLSFSHTHTQTLTSHHSSSHCSSLSSPPLLLSLSNDTGYAAAGCTQGFDLKEQLEAWRSLPYAAAAASMYYPYDGHAAAMAGYPFPNS